MVTILDPTDERRPVERQIAARDGQIKFIINRAGSPFSAGKTYLWEIKNELVEEGVGDPELIEQILLALF